VNLLNDFIKLSNSELRRLIVGGAVEIGDQTIMVDQLNNVYDIPQHGLRVRIGKKIIANISYKE
jgi:tyrosyl-tRNA synthetase